jgi:hypothetical protein
MARHKVSSTGLQELLRWLAILQLLALVCDVYENCCLLKWISAPDKITGFGFYHWLVMVKWVLALSAALFAVPPSFKKRMTRAHQV